MKTDLDECRIFLLWSHGTWASRPRARHKSRPAVSRYLVDRPAGD